jgi:F-type H+-transporting ATPase subunit epsilon
MEYLFLEIITPEKMLFSGEVISVKVPGSKGSFEVLVNHAPIISTLSAGQVKVKDKSGTHLFDVKGGVIEVLRNKVVLLADTV